MMRSSRSSHVRAKIVALLASMAALWGFAAYVTVSDGLNVLFVSTLNDNVGRPTESLVDALQQERRLAAVAVVDSGAAEQLATARERTDRVLASWRDGVASPSLGLAASGQLKQRIGEASAELDRLAELRAVVDEAELDRNAAVARYTAMIDAGFAIYGSISVLDDEEIAQQSRTLIELSRARELLSQEDALLAGAFAEGELSDQDIAGFTSLVGTQRFMYETTSVELTADDHPLYQEVAGGPAVAGLRALEEALIQDAQAGSPPPFAAREWQETIVSATTAMRDLELSLAERTLQRATPAAVGVVVRLLLAGGLGLLALVTAVVVSITTARALVRQLERLRDAARDLASNRLPRVVERLSVGEKVDVATEAPPLRFGNDEIGQVGQAFNAVQETAVKAAVQQAELRHGVRDVFLSLARRTQNLVHKQLGVVDAMERRETDADEMEELYRIDHLATRMRRNAENLIVLSGATPGRIWRRPVPMVDVVRGAIAEVEDYQRVNLMPVQGAALEGRVAGDVIHLLAELIENAASYSPPYAMVNVTGQRVAHGFVVEIEDRGLGMPEADLAAVNRKLDDPPDFSLADASRLGHYVVAKLAQRHGVRVHLRTSPYGGVTAIVLLPKEIMVATAEDDPLPPPAAATLDGAAAEEAGAGGATAAEPADPDWPLGMVRQRRDSIAPLPVPPLSPPEDALPALPVRPPAPDQSHPPAPDQPPAPAQGSAPVPGSAPPAANGRPAQNGHAAGPSGNSQPSGPLAGSEARTPSGLPWRVRQASLPRQLWNEDPSAAEPPTRDPEQVRRAMSSYQIGTQRGRTDAEDSAPTEQANHQPLGEQPRTIRKDDH